MASPNSHSLRSSGPSQAALRLMADYKEIKTNPPEVKKFFFFFFFLLILIK